MNASKVIAATMVVLVVGLLLVGVLVGLPQYNVWRRERAGEAELAEATFSRKIAVEEAQAALDAAELLSKAEVERARGAAEAVGILGGSLQGQDEYLVYLWIQSLHDTHGEVFYVPTEAGLPILEAGRGLMATESVPAGE